MSRPRIEPQQMTPLRPCRRGGGIIESRSHVHASIWVYPSTAEPLLGVPPCGGSHPAVTLWTAHCRMTPAKYHPHLWGNHLFLLVPGRRKRPQFFFAGVSCSEGKTAYMRHSHLILPGRRKCPRKFCGHFRRFWARLATQPSHAASSGTRELPIFSPFWGPPMLPGGSSKFV